MSQKSFDEIIESASHVEEKITIVRIADGNIQTHVDCISDASAFEMLVALVADYIPAIGASACRTAVDAAEELERMEKWDT